MLCCLLSGQHSILGFGLNDDHLLKKMMEPRHLALPGDAWGEALLHKPENQDEAEPLAAYNKAEPCYKENLVRNLRVNKVPIFGRGGGRRPPPLPKMGTLFSCKSLTRKTRRGNWGSSSQTTHQAKAPLLPSALCPLPPALCPSPTLIPSRRTLLIAIHRS